MIIALYRDLSTGLEKFSRNFVFHVKLSDERPQNFTTDFQSLHRARLAALLQVRTNGHRKIVKFKQGVGGSSFCRLGNDHFFCEIYYTVIR